MGQANHEEAEARMTLYFAHGAAKGYSRILIQTDDNDIVALADGYVKDPNVEVWFAFGVRKCFTYTFS